MLSSYLSDATVKLIITAICSIIITGVFFRMSFSYTHKRANKKYAQGKEQAPSIPSFENLSKILFVSAMLLTLSGYWVSSRLLLQINTPVFTPLLGAGFVLYGYFKLEKAFLNLGDNYSPLFEAYMPFKIITHGAYQNIRHPIYLYNLYVSFGLAISSASGLVLICALTGLFYVLKAIRLEEIYLMKSFSEYKKYVKHSWRLIPYIY